MTDERERTGAGAQEESDEGEERPTVAPPFDPIAFAQEVLGGKPSPSSGTPAVRPPSIAPGSRALPPKTTPKGGLRAPEPTLSDPGELEDARRRSAEPTTAPDPPPSSLTSGPILRRPTPSGLMSLANARVPSNLPPRNLPPVSPPPRKESVGAIGAVDKEWVELATRPPPPAFDEAVTTESSRKTKPPVAGISQPPPLNLDLDDDAATRPPPPMQQELIDAMARGDAPPSTKQAPDLSSAMAQAALRSMPVPSPVAPPAPPTLQEMNDRVALGDYSGALEIAERLLEIDASDEAANACAENCRSVLKQMYTARIGPLDRVPMVMVARDQLRWLSIDHRAGFVLSLVDGVSSLEMILDVSGMPELDALRILSELAQQRIISFR